MILKLTPLRIVVEMTAKKSILVLTSSELGKNWVTISEKLPMARLPRGNYEESLLRKNF